MALIVEIVPLYTGPFTSRWDTGSDSEWICNWSLILTTSRGATQNLSGTKRQLESREPSEAGETYRETRPAIPPARTTCPRVP